MPAIQLDDGARRLLTTYRWPGNVRELKNIVERISVIEEVRDITADVLRMHLPNLSMEKLPVLALHQLDDRKIFSSEREILYQVLFDMKNDVNELKKLVHDIMNSNVQMEPMAYDNFTSSSVHQPNIRHSSILDAETVEETLSLEDVEKDMIRKALDRHSGRRKNAASDLQISERTLYRKIKEFGLE